MSGLRAQNKELMELGLTLPGFIERKQVIASLPSLGLLTLAGLTPKKINLSYLEVPKYDPFTEIPGEFDVVAISSFTAQIDEAYALADAYRRLGTKVILGGLHVTARPEEAAKHADAIVLGEGELYWENLLNDLTAGTLKPLYDARHLSFNLENAPIPRYELLDVTQYNRLTVQTQRGCPFECEFCASSIRLSDKYKLKPIKKVVEEIQRIKSIWPHPFIELADDNTFSNKVHAKRLAKALSELNIKWFTETDLSVAQDEDLLAMLRDSGCRQLLIGLESPSKLSLQHLELKTNWKEQQFDQYYTAIQKIQSYGISVNGCFILGLDGDDPSSFEKVLKFVQESGLSEVQITIQTPFPGTPLYERLKKEGRLLKENFWNQCTLFDVTYQPKNMTVNELSAHFRWLMKELYADDVAKKRKTLFLKRYRKLKHPFLAAKTSLEGFQ